jgi:hypothetical protein
MCLTLHLLLWRNYLCVKVNANYQVALGLGTLPTIERYNRAGRQIANELVKLSGM